MDLMWLTAYIVITTAVAIVSGELGAKKTYLTALAFSTVGFSAFFTICIVRMVGA